MFKKKDVSAVKDAGPSFTADTQRQLLAQVDADEAAAAKDEPLPQGDNQWAAPPRSGRTRVTRQQAQAIVRQRIGMRRPTLTERIEFQAEFEVIEDEPMPLPSSPTHHAEILAARAAAAKPLPRPPASIIATVRAALLMRGQVQQQESQQAEAPKKRATFFT